MTLDTNWKIGQTLERERENVILCHNAYTHPQHAEERISVRHAHAVSTLVSSIASVPRVVLA